VLDRKKIKKRWQNKKNVNVKAWQKHLCLVYPAYPTEFIQWWVRRANSSCDSCRLAAEACPVDGLTMGSDCKRWVHQRCLQTIYTVPVSAWTSRNVLSSSWEFIIPTGCLSVSFLFGYF